ncbi:MAG: AraC family transcriptional regulator [Bdellovibrio sp.]|nr:AraC family transcriptional regulator [Bdellovibrio sp.]
MTFRFIASAFILFGTIGFAGCKSAEVKQEVSAPVTAPKVAMEELNIIGIKTRTTNAQEMGGKGKILPLWQEFYGKKMLAKIPGKTDSQVYGVYHDYESDMNGAYSLLVGVKVAPGTKAPKGMTLLKIPAQDYVHIASPKGEMPGVVVDAWKRVWSATDFKRKYSYDFEIYGDKAKDPKSAEVELYISTL